MAIAVVALASELRSQSTAEYRERLNELLRRRIIVDSISMMRAEARATRLSLDTIRVGDLILITVPGRTARVRELAEIAWPIISTAFGRETSTLRRQVFIPRFGVDVAGQGEQANIFVPMGDTGSAAALVQVAAMVLYQATDTALHAWVGEPYVPPGDRQLNDGPIYVELVTSPLREIQKCYAGDLESCRLALGLAGRNDPWLSWYGAAERRQLVEVTFPNSRRREDCVTHHDDAACLATLRLESRDWTPPPFSGAARVNLLATSLRSGGSGAYERLLSSHGDLWQRLGHAASRPSDSLLIVWRNRILSARPTTDTLTTRSAWVAVAWCLIMAALAFRSTRWR